MPKTNALAPGLCSVTLRQCPPAQVLEVAQRAGLTSIEWGGDVHIPPGDLSTAQTVRRLTERAGLRVASYGSYFRAETTDAAEIDQIVLTAQWLGAPRIRIWAGTCSSTVATPGYRQRIADGTRRLADRAGQAGISIAFEFHGGTLTDDHASALDLLKTVNRPTVGTYWQPPNDTEDRAVLAGLDAVLPHVVAAHVFSWWPGTQRHPLTARSELWRAAFARLCLVRGPVDVLLEFVPDDDPAMITAEAAALRDLAGL